MHLNIELPDDVGLMVKAQAQEEGLSPDRFISRVLLRTLASRSKSKSQDSRLRLGMACSRSMAMLLPPRRSTRTGVRCFATLRKSCK